MNNGGWGLRIMLFLCAILIFSLFLSASLLGRNFRTNFSGSFNSQEFSYRDLEVRLINGAKKYINDYYQNALNDESDFIVNVSYKKLKEEEYLNQLINPKTQKECNGYVVFKKIGTYFHYDGFINCPTNYKTDNYQEEYENY